MIDVALDVDALVAGIGRISGSLARNIPDALELAAGEVADEAKANHSYTDRTGALTNSIMLEGVHGSWGADLHAIVAAGAEHGIYVEKGTRAHKIKPRHRKALRFPMEGGFAFAKGVNHPGTAATNFLSNALDARLSDVNEHLQDAVNTTFAEAGFEVP